MATTTANVAIVLAASLLMHEAAGASGSRWASLCPSPAARKTAPAVYLAVGVDSLVQLKLSPPIEGSPIRRVERDEMDMLCAEGFDVRAVDDETFPTAFSVVRRNGRVYGNVWSSGRTPADTRTQWLRFDFDANNYFVQGEHVPIALFLDADAAVAVPPSLIGNGIVIGSVNLTPNGCGSGSFPGAPVANTEVEAFWRGGNALWGESCGNLDLHDGEGYRFFVAAGTQGAVRYEALGEDGDAISRAIVDTSPRRPPLDTANGGILIASTNFCARCADFELHFTNVASGWSAIPIDRIRVTDAMRIVPDMDSVTFDAQPLGTASAARRIAFSDVDAGDHTLTFAIGADVAPHCIDRGSATSCAQELALERQSFVLDASDCATLHARQTCEVAVRFFPQGAFYVTARLEYRVDDGASIRHISLEGFGLPAIANDGTTQAIEYFNPTRGHYFVTTLPSEQALLDTGAIAGWKRTGEWFAAYLPGRAAKHAKPVCRYYGTPEAGLDSHFYSALASECDGLAQRLGDGWILETADLFDIGLPDANSGACLSGMPVYRLWNARESSNHRYTTDLATRARMIAAGWIPEGYGSLRVAMCDATR